MLPLLVLAFLAMLGVVGVGGRILAGLAALAR
jgi:hypothetical protein